MNIVTTADRKPAAAIAKDAPDRLKIPLAILSFMITHAPLVFSF